MRIAHFSDIHLSYNNYKIFVDSYRKALIKDLEEYNRAYPIDLVVVTGDLVDKGGHSLMNLFRKDDSINSPYDVFEKEFVAPISNKLGISNDRFLFIPGNHDIDESQIRWIHEKDMKFNLNESNVKDYLKKNAQKFNFTNRRIQKFKEFEKRFHFDSPNYNFSNNESIFTYTSNNKKVGFILLNDSWRCSTCKLLKEEHNYHYFGVSQLENGLKKLELLETDINVCLFHHSVTDFKESKEILSFLKQDEINFFLYGHYHEPFSENHMAPGGSCYGFRGRSALNKPKEEDIRFQPGYHLLDLNLTSKRITQIHYRRYSDGNKQFLPDLEWAPQDGIDRNEAHGGNGYIIGRLSNTKKVFNIDVKKLYVG